MSHEKGSPTSGAHTAELTSTAWTGAWCCRPVLLVLPRAEPGGACLAQPQRMHSLECLRGTQGSIYSSTCTGPGQVVHAPGRTAASLLLIRAGL